MLQSNQPKDLTKAEAMKKAEAWKTLNEVLVKTNSEYMSRVRSLLTSKQVQHEELKAKIEAGKATENDNAEYLFLGGYVQCLKDLLNVRGNN